MDCCSNNGLGEEFDSKEAQKKLKSYLQNGLDSWSRTVRNGVQARGVEGATILEIGSGIGALHMELLRAGATSAVGIDISPAQIEAARTLAEKQGLKDSVTYHVTDFVASAEEIDEADIVILDKVICCYPNMPALVTTSAKHSRRILAFAYPRVTWLTRTVNALGNIAMMIRRRAFRSYLHSPEEVNRIAESLGFSQVSHKKYGPLGIWQLAMYERN